MPCLKANLWCSWKEFVLQDWFTLLILRYSNGFHSNPEKEWFSVFAVLFTTHLTYMQFPSSSSILCQRKGREALPSREKYCKGVSRYLKVDIYVQYSHWIPCVMGSIPVITLHYYCIGVYFGPTTAFLCFIRAKISKFIVPRQRDVY